MLTKVREYRKEVRAGLRTKASPLVVETPRTRAGSESINRAELHLSGLALNSGEVRPDSRVRQWRGHTASTRAAGGLARRIESNTISGSTSGECSHALGVRHVERFQTKFERMAMLTSPGKRELLGDTHIESEVTGQTERITFSGFAGECI